MVRFFCLVLLSGLLFAEEKIPTDRGDPGISQMLARIETFEQSRQRGIEQRTKKYVADLKALEKKIPATGNLDKVLEVTKERKEWEAGNQTPSINPRDASRGLELRKLRYYFDRDLQLIREKRDENTNRIAPTIISEIDELIKALTTEGKIAEAVTVRNIKKEFLIATTPPVEDTPTNQEKPSAESREPDVVTVKDAKKWGRNTWINHSPGYRPEDPLNPPQGSIRFEEKTAKTKATVPVEIHVENLPRRHEWAIIAVSQSGKGEYRELMSGYNTRKLPTELTISLYPFGEPWEIYLLAMPEKNWESVVEIRAQFDREPDKRAISDELKASRNVKKLKQDGNLILGNISLLVTR